MLFTCIICWFVICLYLFFYLLMLFVCFHSVSERSVCYMDSSIIQQLCCLLLIYMVNLLIFFCCVLILKYLLLIDQLLGAFLLRFSCNVLCNVHLPKWVEIGWCVVSSSEVVANDCCCIIWLTVTDWPPTGLLETRRTCISTEWHSYNLQLKMKFSQWVLL